MPLTTLPKQSPRTSRSRLPRTARSRTHAIRHAGDAAGAHGSLARYTDAEGRLREVLARPGHAGTVLVLDRDATTLGDRRLVAHLAADEPPENAALVGRHYLRDPRGRRCRSLAPEDLLTAPFSEECEQDDPGGLDPAPPPQTVELRDRHGSCHRLVALATDLSIPELRWCRREGGAESGRPESVRDAVACMESYEPVRALTVKALALHRGDPAISVAVLRSELGRIDASRIVLNRGLRQAVLHAMRTRGLSLSEIALRCGRIKRDGKGNSSGETSWLSRRVGISPESGGDGQPTPWIHSEVLALIAREGLGISPREVEL
jgi:hypothetical protein